jgi:hypothetical protein
LACMDESCGRPENLVAMMSRADGIVKKELMNDPKTFNVVKHPKVEPTKRVVPMSWNPTSLLLKVDTFVIPKVMKRNIGVMETFFFKRSSST